MTDVRPFEMRAHFKGSPTGTLRASIAAELADGTIPCACPHPVTAERLSLPSRTLQCRECAEATAGTVDSGPGPCTSCGEAGAAAWTVWLDEAAHVLVVARVCALRHRRERAPVPELVHWTVARGN
ncbi:MAG: hypothetical protein ACRDOA_01705 [Streptosporangiaceae bacterium]